MVSSVMRMRSPRLVLGGGGNRRKSRRRPLFLLLRPVLIASGVLLGLGGVYFSNLDQQHDGDKYYSTTTPSTPTNPSSIGTLLFQDEEVVVTAASRIVAFTNAAATTAGRNGSPTASISNNNNNNHSSIANQRNNHAIMTPESERAVVVGVGLLQIQYTEKELLLAWNRLSSKNHATSAAQKKQKRTQHSNSITLLNAVIPVISRRSTSSSNDITAAVHFSVDKLDIFLFLCHRWNGPISASIYMTNETDISTFISYVNTHQEEFYQCQFHILMEQTTKTTPVTSTTNNGSTGSSGSSTGGGYPHNILRQMAIDTIESDYVLILDVDFVTQPNAHDQLYRLFFNHQSSSTSSPSSSSSSSYYYSENDRKLVQEQLQRTNNYTLFVLPAFELKYMIPPTTFLKNDEETTTTTTTTTTPTILPTTRKEAKSMIEQKQLMPFHVKHFFPGHGPTDFSTWLGRSGRHDRRHRRGNNNNNNNDMILKTNNNASTSPPSFYSISYDYRFEPYVIGYRTKLPKFWTGFRGFGFNKWSFFLETYYMGFEFVTLRDFFVIHLDHLDTKNNNKNKNSVGDDDDTDTDTNTSIIVPSSPNNNMGNNNGNSTSTNMNDRGNRRRGGVSGPNKKQFTKFKRYLKETYGTTAAYNNSITNNWK